MEYPLHSTLMRRKCLRLHYLMNTATHARWIYLFIDLVVCILLGFACFQILERLNIYGITHAIYIFCTYCKYSHRQPTPSHTKNNGRPHRLGRVVLSFVELEKSPDEWSDFTAEKWMNDIGRMTDNRMDSDRTKFNVPSTIYEYFKCLSNANT